MTKEDWVRLGMHIPWGLVAAFPLSWGILLLYARPQVPWLVCLIITFSGIVASSCLLWAELIYEAFNDWRKHDESYKDVLGIVWGYIIGVIILGRVLL